MEQLSLALIAICSIAVVSYSESASGGCVLILIVAIPNLHDHHEPSPSWERGKELLHGAQIAANKSECQLELIEVDHGICGTANNFNLLQQLFAQLKFVNSSQNLIGIVGLTCNVEFSLVIPSLSSGTELRKVAAIIADLANPIVSLDYKTMLIKGLFRFMKKINWRKLGVVTETENTYFSHTAELLYKEAKQDPNIDITTYQQLHVQMNSGATHHPIQIMSKITFISANLQTTVAILCSAYQNKMLWPGYVFILHSFLAEDLTNVHAACNVTKALENVLFIREQKTMDMFGNEYEDFHNMRYHSQSFQNNHKVNPYSVVLHNLVMEASLWLSNLSMPINESSSQYRIIEVTQYHNRIRMDIPISFIHKNGTVSIIDKKIISVSDDFEMQFKGASTGYTIIFSIEIIIGFVLVSIMLIGYIYFRNEPEVKSTSFTLSLLIFLGCYLHIIVLSLLLYLDQPISISLVILNTICGILPWISGLGVSTLLIIATVLVKLTRVYHIFNRMTPKPLGKKSSDLFLAGYVLLILSPLIVILTTWTITDRFKITFRPSSKSGFIQRQCLSDYLSIWIPLLVLNLVVLFLVLMIVAVRSRHIHEKHFRHTRRVNMFIFCLFFSIALPVSYWWLLENLGTAVPLYIATIPLHIGHFAIVILCQLLLIAPKLLMPLSRCLCGKSGSN